MSYHDITGGRSEELLVRSVQGGDTDAFDAIYRTYRRRVERVCRRYLRDDRDVEEAIQDTFRKAFEALPRFNGQFRLAAWLARIAVNVSIDRNRSARRRLMVVAGLDIDAADDAVPAVHDQVIDRDTPARDLLKNLRPDYARALELRAVHDASHEEIGEVLGKSPDQVKALLHRARLAFRKAWADAGAGIIFAVAAGGLGLWLRVLRPALSTAASQTQVSAGSAGEIFGPPVALLGDTLRI